MIPFARPFLGTEESRAAARTVLSRWVTQGPKTVEFEKRFAEKVGAPFACSVSSGTAAIFLALKAVGVRPGDVVLTVSHSFIASANAVRTCGAEPVFADVDEGGHNMDPEALQRILERDCRRKGRFLFYKPLRRLVCGESPLKFFRTGRVAAILPIHQIGIPCRIHEIVSLGRKYGLPVVEDAACAVGSGLLSRNGKEREPIGKPHGDIACFSFHARKVLTTGDGGMITTRYKDLDTFCRLNRVHGMDIPSETRHRAKKIVIEKYLTTGFNFRMTDIQAAIGIEQLKKLGDILSRRRRLAALYEKYLKNISWLGLPEVPSGTHPNWQSYSVLLLKDAPVKRMRLMELLFSKGIAARRGVMNAHEEAPYRPAKWKLPKSEASSAASLLLPFYPEMTEAQVRRVCRALSEAR